MTSCTNSNSSNILVVVVVVVVFVVVEIALDKLTHLQFNLSKMGLKFFTFVLRKFNLYKEM